MKFKITNLSGTRRDPKRKSRGSATSQPVCIGPRHLAPSKSMFITLDAAKTYRTQLRFFFLHRMISVRATSGAELDEFNRVVLGEDLVVATVPQTVVEQFTPEPEPPAPEPEPVKVEEPVAEELPEPVVVTPPVVEAPAPVKKKRAKKAAVEEVVTTATPKKTRKRRTRTKKSTTEE